MKSLLVSVLLSISLTAAAQEVLHQAATSHVVKTSVPLAPSHPIPDSEAQILERASAETAVEVPHKSAGQKIAENLREKGLSKDAAIVAISTLPIVELRGAIPVGHVLYSDKNKSTRLGRDDLYRSARIFLYAVLGNMLPVPFILLLLGPVSNLCMKIPVGKKFFDWLFARTRRKTADIEKYETLGLTIFVAIPLPATGAWTGAMAGWLLGMSFAHSMLSIFLGVLIAGVVMTALALLGWIGAAIAGVVLALFFGGILAQALRKK
ncbi:MAG: COG2426 family protein [Kiritimatiellia bacterium]